MIRHLEGVFFVPGVGSPLKEGIFAWVKGIGSKFQILYLRIWSLEEKAGNTPRQEKGSGVKDLPGAGVPSWTCRSRLNKRYRW